mmetsp:Transcript_11065/g.18515  ORF Transcript_11065/g.18515 Transcript_11065/m.18515 type:complete len:164 (+) Transcript_11065:1546-2037(+)
MLDGALEKLIDFGDPQTQALLDNYVFKIIPVLNPDGVARGQWRTDTKGVDLNRKYEEPSKWMQPTIHAAKNAVLAEFDKNPESLKMIVDFHAHCSKKGCFVYGNFNQDLGRQIQAMLLPKLMAINCKFFDFDASRFISSSENADWPHKEGRGGSARSVLHRET